MAIGFTPKHTEEFLLEDLLPAQFMVLALETMLSLKWEVSFLSATGLIAYTNNGIMSWNAEIRIDLQYEKAILRSSSTGSDILDLGKNKKNITRFVSTLKELRPHFSAEEMASKYMVMRNSFPEIGNDLIQEPQLSGWNTFLSYFIPRGGYFVTPILIHLNLLVFVLMLASGVHFLSPESEDLLKWGANFRPMTLENGWWRLLTCCFVHIGILHLLMNMYALVYIGLLLEPYLGRARFTLAYLLTGILASLTSLWWHDYTVSAGASGAVFGMYGVFLAMLTTDLIEKTARKAMLSSIGIFVGYNLLFGLKGGVDNAAHLGGLISGLLFGYAFVPGIKEPKDSFRKLVLPLSLSLALLIMCFWALNRIPNDLGIYQMKMEEFTKREKASIEVYNKIDSLPKTEELRLIAQDGIDNWKANIELIHGFYQLDLPANVRLNNKQLEEYAELRLKSFELLYKAVEAGTSDYDAEMNEMYEKIKNVLNAMNAPE